MSEVLLELFRHKTWATLRLIEHCSGLADEDLEATIPGTYGSIRRTLGHLVRSEESYFWRVTGRRLSPEMPRDAEGIPLPTLAERIRQLGAEWEKLIQDPRSATKSVTVSDGRTMLAVVPMAQAVHHADDHRTHVMSILGARGLAVPDLDVWSYAESAGQMRQPEHQPQ